MTHSKIKKVFYVHVTVRDVRTVVPDNREFEKKKRKKILEGKFTFKLFTLREERENI